MPRSTALLALTALTTLTTSGSARAGDFYWSLKYDPGVAVGSLRSFAPSVTPVGFDLDARYWFAGHFSLGIGGAITRFYDTLPHGTYPLDRGAITGTIYRHVDVAALAPEAHVYFAPHADVIPYAGVGVGVAWVSPRVLVSDVDVSETHVGFIVSPEAGILLPFDRDDFLRQAIVLGARYSFSSAGFRDVSATSFVSLQVGALIY
jgi:hypothetical protein